MSKLGTSHLVMDVNWFSTTPGTQVISYPKKTPPADNQLWMKEDAGENAFYLVSKLSSSCKITIQVYNIYNICGSPGLKSNIIPLRILTALPRSKCCSAVLPLRAGLIRAM